MGELTFFLGLQVKQKEDGIFISQDKYVGEILNKFGFFSIRSASTPMETHKDLTKDEDGEDVDVHLYRSMIGSLMYLTSSRLDIMFSVCVCSKFQVQPKVSHLNAVKRIFRYLKGQPELGLWYPKDSPLILEAFSDSDYAGASLDRKSTTRGCQFLGSRYSSVGPPIKVGDEAVHKELGDIMDRATTTASSLEVEQDNGSTGFHQIVGFLHTTHIKYALTENPTIYISLIHQFWETTSATTNQNKEIEITTTIDGRLKTVTEVSIRRHLKLEDSAGTLFPAGKGLTIPVDSHNTPTVAPSTLQPTFTTPETSPSKITSSPSLSSPTQQSLPSTHTTHDAEEPATMPHDSSLQRKVKKLEQTVNSTQARRIFRIVVSDDEEGTSWIQEDIEIQDKISDDTEVVLEEEEPTELVEDQRSGEKGEKEKRKDKGKAIMEEDESVQKKTKKQLEQEKLGHEEAIRLQKQIDEEERQRIARDAEIAKHDPAVIRYHALQNRAFSVPKVRKNMCIYLINQGGYKMRHFKAMSYEDIIPIFEKLWDQIHSFMPMDSELEIPKLKRAEPVKRQSIKEEKKSDDSSKPAEGIRKKTFARKRESGKDSEQSKEGAKTVGFQKFLQLSEYDIWAMKMEHYLEHTDYPIWEVIQKGNGLVQVSTDTNGQIKVLPSKTAKEILARERERKERTTLLMAIPEDHLAKFHKMTDAKEMWEEIKFRFEGLHKGYDRFQSLLSQLEIHGAGVSTEDANQKFLRLFLAFASFMGFIVYQMDVKSAFLYGTIDEEVYVSQPPGFVDPDHPKKVYKVVKALYGLHQAPRVWYATLSTFLEKHGYKRVLLSDSEEEETKAHRRKTHDLYPLVSLVQELITPSKTVNALGEEQVEDVSPTTLEAAAILTRVKKIKSVDKGKRYKRRKSSKEFAGTGLDFEDVKSAFEKVSTGDIKVSSGIEEINTGSLDVNIGIDPVTTDSIRVSIPSPDRGRREGKAPMTEEEETQASRQTKEQIIQEEAGLAKAIKLDASEKALEKEEVAKQFHLDSLLA
ncbi:uncharacterized mitochondrial protein-like protein [Tanacetum coccineum]